MSVAYEKDHTHDPKHDPKHARWRGKAHLPDPYLPEPYQDCLDDPSSWTIHACCGIVLRHCRLVPGSELYAARDDGTELCQTCERRSGR